MVLKVFVSNVNFFKVELTWIRTQDLLLEIGIHETTQNRLARHPGHPKMYHSQNVLHNK